MLTGYQPVRLLSLLVIIILAGLSLPTQSLSATSKERNQANIDLTPYLQLLASDQENTSLEEAITSKQWKSIDDETYLGSKKREHWIYVDLTPHRANNDAQLLDFRFLVIDRIDAYIYRNNLLIKHYISGDSVPFSMRPINNRKVLFPVPGIGTGTKANTEKLEVYFKTYSEGSTRIPLLLWNTKYFLIDDKFETLWNGFFFGALVILLLYHLLLLIKLRKLDIVAYIFMLIGLIFTSATQWGYGLQYLWPEDPVLTNRVVPMLFFIIAYQVFFYSFLSLNKRHIYIRYSIRFLIALSIPLLILSFTVSLTKTIPPFFVYIVLAHSMGTALSLYLWVKGDQVGRYFFIAITPLYIGFLIDVFPFLGLIEQSFLTDNVNSFSILIFLCLLAMAVAYKIRDFQDKSEQQILQLNENLESKVIERTQALHASLHELKETQNKLIESEKIAALTGLVAGVAHEINTPLGVGITATTSLKGNTETFKNNYQTNTLSRSQMEGYLTTTDDALALIENSFTRASQQVRNFKEITVDQHSNEVHPTRINEHIENVLLLLKTKLNQHNHHIHIDCSQTLEIRSIPNLFTQIFVHLISNSVEHAFNGVQQGNIYISTRTEKNKLHINYRDDGKGLNEEAITTIFDPFNTSNRGGGQTGLGTTITYNIVTQALKGTISCESPEDGGLSYHIEIPAQIVST